VDCRYKLTQHWLITYDIPIAILVCEYIPTGRRNIDRTRKRRTDHERS